MLNLEWTRNIMPSTLLHYSVAYALHRGEKRFPLPALAVGSVIPDIEVPFSAVFFSGILPDHFILHSFVGEISGAAFMLANGTTNLFMLLIFVYIMAHEWGDRWESIWVGDKQ